MESPRLQSFLNHPVTKAFTNLQLAVPIYGAMVVAGTKMIHTEHYVQEFNFNGTHNNTGCVMPNAGPLSWFMFSGRCLVAIGTLGLGASWFSHSVRMAPEPNEQDAGIMISRPDGNLQYGNGALISLDEEIASQNKPDTFGTL